LAHGFTIHEDEEASPEFGSGAVQVVGVEPLTRVLGWREGTLWKQRRAEQ